MPTDLFLDTEFTSVDQPRLISLGMVAAESGGDFYTELSDAWTLGECSLFVLGQVLPLLDDGRSESVLSQQLGDLFELLRWLTAETFDDKKRLLATPELQQAILREMPLALQWEEDTGLGDLRAAEQRRVAAALAGLQPSRLIRGEAGHSQRNVARELATWLERFDRPVRIYADSSLDHQLTQALLRVSGTYPQQIVFALLPPLKPEASLALRLRVQAAKDDFYAAGGRRHHALDDARALALWYREAVRLGVLYPYGS